MKEYIIYAIIFFFPLGVIVSLLLHREGLKGKYIAFIVTVSLAIVISFPVIMQKMGFMFAFCTYMLLLAALTGLFLKTLPEIKNSCLSVDSPFPQTGHDEDAVLLEQGLNGPESLEIAAGLAEGVSREPLFPENPTQSFTDQEIASIHLVEKDELSDDYESKPGSDTVIPEEEGAQENYALDEGEAGSHSALDLMSDADIAQQTVTDVVREEIAGEKTNRAESHEAILSGSDPDAQAAQEPPREKLVSAVVGDNTNVEYEEGYQDKPEGGRLIAQPQPAREMQAETEKPEELPAPTVMAGSDATAEVQTGHLEEPHDDEWAEQTEPGFVPAEEAGFKDGAEEAAAQDIAEGAGEDFADALEIMAQEPPAEEISVRDEYSHADYGDVINPVMDAGPNEEILTAHGVQAIIETNDLEVDQETPAEEMSETAAEPENPAVSGLIEKGFIHKFNHDLAEAAMFFAEALEICRDYELKYMLAMETVTLYKELGRYDDAEQVLQRYISKADRHAIIDEINLQLSYIRILNSELNRLGIPGTPIARVPRWVRINVDEQMKAKNA